jgi:MoxR-like ATPase
VTNEILCQICGKSVKDYLPNHLVEDHNISVEQYLGTYPNAPTVSTRLLTRYEASTKDVVRKAAPDPSQLKIKIGNLPFLVNAEVPEEVCLPLPQHYRIPEKEPLAGDIQQVLVMLRNKRSVYVWGMPGCGKDALFHAFSWMTRTPAIIRQMVPNTDVESWFFSRSFDQQGTYWEEGVLLKALRDGYTTASGKKVPYLVLITDFDRADSSQMEQLRLNLDSIQGRVQGPKGVFPIFPGTVIVATGNTPGGGDTRARMSSNVIDGSIMDRWKVIQFHWMHWEDEKKVLKNKFPKVFSTFPKLEDKLGRATLTLRNKINSNELMAEFTHRSLCHILEQTQDTLDILKELKKPIPDNLMAKTLRVWLDGIPDEDNRGIARAVFDAEFRTLPEGNVSHIDKKNVVGFANAR